MAAGTRSGSPSISQATEVAVLRSWLRTARRSTSAGRNAVQLRERQPRRHASDLRERLLQGPADPLEVAEHSVHPSRHRPLRLQAVQAQQDEADELGRTIVQLHPDAPQDQVVDLHRPALAVDLAGAVRRSALGMSRRAPPAIRLPHCRVVAEPSPARAMAVRRRASIATPVTAPPPSHPAKPARCRPERCPQRL